MDQTSAPADRIEPDELVTASLPLVHTIVSSLCQRYPSHCDRDELVAAGTFGLVEAARRFDPARGVPFERWAALRIRGAVVDAVRAMDFAPRALRSAARELATAREALQSQLGRTPVLAEVADRLALPLGELVALEGRLHGSTVLSLDAPVQDGEDDTLAGILLDPGADPLEQLERRERDGYVHDAIASLPPRLRAVLVGYFLEGRTSLELAELLDVTESRISQVRSEALAMLKDGIGAQYDPQSEGTTTKRAAKRREAFAAAVGSSSSWRERLSHQHA